MTTYLAPITATRVTLEYGGDAEPVRDTLERAILRGQITARRAAAIRDAEPVAGLNLERIAFDHGVLSLEARAARTDAAEREIIARIDADLDAVVLAYYRASVTR